MDVLLSAEEAAAAPLVLKGGAHVRSPDDEPHGEPAAEILSMLDSVVARNNISPCHRPVRHKSDQRYSFSYFGVTLVTRGVLYSWSPCCRRSQSLVVQSLPQIGDSRELQIILCCLPLVIFVGMYCHSDLQRFQVRVAIHLSTKARSVGRHATGEVPPSAC